MDALDLILVVVLLASAFRGFRRGAAVQILSYGGALGGLALGVVLVLLVCPHVAGQHAKTVAALLLLLGARGGARHCGTPAGRGPVAPASQGPFRRNLTQQVARSPRPGVLWSWSGCWPRFW